MSVLLIAGIGVFVAGLVAIVFGIPVKEFSFGNTLILAGSVAACTGLIMVSLWLVVRELKAVARRLGSPGQAQASRARSEFPALPAAPFGFDDEPSAAGGPLFSRDQSSLEHAGADDPGMKSPSASPAPWQEEAAARDRARPRGDELQPVGIEPLAASNPEPAAKPRRNLLFSSSSRKERERATARSADPAAAGMLAESADLKVADLEIPPRGTFDDAWPQSDRPRAESGGRNTRAPSTFAEAAPAMAAPDRNVSPQRNDSQPPVTVLKSGVVDGMAYSLYSDGSIEAQMPEGMMRFASIDELRAHLDHRP